MRQLLAWIFCICLVPSSLWAQKTLQEGIIVYAVHIGPLSSGSDFTEQAGSYTISIKGVNIRKELRMNSGYQNIILQSRNTQSAYSLQAAGGKSFAIQLKPEDLKERQKPYEEFNLKDEDGVMTIAGQSCRKATISYKDGSQSSICYSTEWLSPDDLLLDRFPGIRNIPLSFEYRNEEGTTMHFSAEKIEQKPVENSLFRVPPEYKIISNAEYKSLPR